MKIAFVVDCFPSVSETFILAQIVGLIERGHEVHIYATFPHVPAQNSHNDVKRFRLIERTRYRADIPRSKLSRLRSAVSLMLRNGWHCPKQIFDSLNVVRHGRRAFNLCLLHDRFSIRYSEWNYDVIHCHYGPNGVRVVDSRDIGMFDAPIITTFHGYDANWLPRFAGPDVYKRLFSSGNLFTVGSDFMRKRIISLGAPAERIVKLPMGVDLSRFIYSMRENKNGHFTLLTVARLSEVKGIEFALHAIAIVKRKYPKIRYFVAGDGPLRSKLKDLAADLGIATEVQFLGAVTQEEVLQLHRGAHALLLPSVVTRSGEEENQPVVLAEAQASGLPVIASSIGGISESMINEESGLLVPQRNPEALANAILLLAEHPEECLRMGRAGRAHVEAYFDLEKLQNQLVDIYHVVVSHRTNKTMP